MKRMAKVRKAAQKPNPFCSRSKTTWTTRELAKAVRESQPKFVASLLCSHPDEFKRVAERECAITGRTVAAFKYAPPKTQKKKKKKKKVK